MRDKRVVPLRPVPTMKMGESAEDSTAVEAVAPKCGSDIKHNPQLSRGLSQFEPELRSRGLFS